MALWQTKTERAKFDWRIHAQPRNILAYFTQYESEVSFLNNFLKPEPSQKDLFRIW